MKILYVISCNGGGNGGHNHSLNHISKAIEEKAEVKIVSVGLGEPNVLLSNPNYMGKLSFKWWNIWSLNQQLKDLYKTFKPDVIHCFDGSSALILMAQPFLFGEKIMYTKCGGPNERKMVAQVASDVILFSKENYKDHIENPRFKKTDIHLIPNRINAVKTWEVKEQKYIKNTSKFNFLRVARIGKTYMSSMLQAMNLVEKLNELNISKEIHLYIIGTVQDETVFNNLNEIASEKKICCTFITDEYTKEASKMLYLADAVLGTGRGVMEAMSLGLPTFVPVQGEELPSLLREENFQTFFKTNFSPRGKYQDYNLYNEISISKKLVEDDLFYEESSVFASDIAKEKFILNPQIIHYYLSLYENLIKKPSRAFIFKNLLPLVYYINAFRRAQK